MPEIHAWTFNQHTLAENAQEAQRLADWIHTWSVENAPYKLDLGINASALSITLRQLVAALAAPALTLDQLRAAMQEVDWWSWAKQDAEDEQYGTKLLELLNAALAPAGAEKEGK